MRRPGTELDLLCRIWQGLCPSFNWAVSPSGTWITFKLRELWGEFSILQLQDWGSPSLAGWLRGGHSQVPEVIQFFAMWSPLQPVLHFQPLSSLVFDLYTWMSRAHVMRSGPSRQSPFWLTQSQLIGNLNYICQVPEVVSCNTLTGVISHYIYRFIPHWNGGNYIRHVYQRVKILGEILDFCLPLCLSSQERKWQFSKIF